MIRFIAIALLFTTAPVCAQDWLAPDWRQVGPGRYAPPDAPNQLLQGVFLYPPADFRWRGPGIWHRVSLFRNPSNPRGLPRGANMIGLLGIGITTNPESTGTYGGTFTVRRAGSTYEPGYQVQLCTVNEIAWTPSIGYIWVGAPDGDRKPAYVPVALNADCEFEFKYTAQNPPGGVALTPGVNLQFNFIVAEWSGKPDLFPWLNE